MRRLEMRCDAAPEHTSSSKVISYHIVHNGSKCIFISKQARDAYMRCMYATRVPVNARCMRLGGGEGLRKYSMSWCVKMQSADNLTHGGV